MEKNTYPNWSVYIQQGGQLKYAGRATKRIPFSTYESAINAAMKVYGRYKGTVDVVVLRYDAPYQATIIHVITKEHREIVDRTYPI